MADFDEELLALAGSGERARPDSDAEQGSSEAGFSRRRARNVDQTSDAGGDDDVEDEDVDPYPYLGLYKDEDDREYIDDLNELEREEILAARRDEKSKREQKRSLLAMYQSQQGQGRIEREELPPKKRKAPSAAPKRRRPAAEDMMEDEDEDEEPAVPESDAGSDYEEDHAPKKKRRPLSGKASKRDKLKQLSARVKAKKAGPAESSDDEPQRRGYASSESDEYDKANFERPSRRDRQRHGSPTTSDDSEWDNVSEGPPVEALNALKLDRALVVNVMHRPGWEDFLRHKFIRFSWGPRLDDRGHPVRDANGRTEEVFRIHQVEGVVHGDDYYELAPGKATNVRIQIRLFGEKKTVDLRFVSNQPFSQSERDRYVATVRGARGKFPSVGALRRAEERMTAYRDKAQTPEEVRLLLKNKKEAGLAFKTQQQQGKSRDPRAAPPGPPPAPPTQLMSQAPAHKLGRMDQDTMAALNERSRKADRQRILETEKRRAAAKRASATATSSPAPGHAAPRTIDVPLPAAVGQGSGVSLLPEALKNQLVSLAERVNDTYASALLSVDVDVGNV